MSGLAMLNYISRSFRVKQVDGMSFFNLGIGNYYSEYGYDSLTHAKSVLISSPDVATDHLFPPFTKEKVHALDQWCEY